MASGLTPGFSDCLCPFSALPYAPPACPCSFPASVNGSTPFLVCALGPRRVQEDGALPQGGKDPPPRSPLRSLTLLLSLCPVQLSCSKRWEQILIFEIPGCLSLRPRVQKCLHYELVKSQVKARSPDSCSWGVQGCSACHVMPCPQPLTTSGPGSPLWP